MKTSTETGTNKHNRNLSKIAGLSIAATIICAATVLPAAAITKIDRGTAAQFYQNSGTENLLGEVNTLNLNYRVKGIHLATRVHVPAYYSPTTSYPTVVIAMPANDINTQLIDFYAKKLAKRGFIVIHQASAAQSPINAFASHAAKTEYDLTQLQVLTEIISVFPGADKLQLGLLSFFDKSNAVLSAAVADQRFSTVATISMFNADNVQFSEKWDSQLDQPQQTQQMAAKTEVEHFQITEQVFTDSNSLGTTKVMTLTGTLPPHSVLQPSDFKPTIYKLTKFFNQNAC